jgi:zinc protease
MYRRSRVNPKGLLSLLFVLPAVIPSQLRADANSDQPAVTRATLPNGMHVVINCNSLAPVVTVETNIVAGGDETPDGFPGMAHAQEHMAFRSCTGMTADQTAAIYAKLGGENNADTQQNITQYYATVPTADLDVALLAQATCMRGIEDSQAQVGPGAWRDRAEGGPRSIKPHV